MNNSTSDPTYKLFIMVLLLVILAQFWYDVFLKGYDKIIGHPATVWHLLIMAILLTIIFFIGLKYIAKISISEII